jgi:hypothetical protein
MCRCLTSCQCPASPAPALAGDTGRDSTPRLPAAASFAACWFVYLRPAGRLALGARRRRRERLRAREQARGGQPGRGADRAMASKRISKELQVCPDRPARGTRFTLRPLHPPMTLYLRPCPRRLVWTALQTEHAAGPEACHILKFGSRPDAPRPPGSCRTCKRIRRPPAAPGQPATTSSTGRSGLDGALAQRDSSLNQGRASHFRQDQSCLVESKVLYCVASGSAGAARAALVWQRLQEGHICALLSFSKSSAVVVLYLAL